jgi:hypothetical protein
MKQTYQVEGVSLEGRVLEDVKIRQGRVWGRVIAVTTSEAAVGAEDAGGEDVTAEDQPKKVVAHELQERRI